MQEMNNKQTMGKGFLDAFQSKLTPQNTPQPVQLTPNLPKNTGINKKKSTNLQQNLVNSIMQPQPQQASQPQQPQQ